ncbi:signal transducer and activator of transcription 6 isoform X2 [Astyanax mexicanus]|uniref:signal transducer and activator of transcription 6 isoform X2 n=1 Tax=Astyanax mexicanus TaxID=7994 RepID=UPI0020CAEA0D|nr:signal transducer and activator of transcription 6 isoform X2 [Astyanax mexicanus]
MALWMQISQLLPKLPNQTLNELYPDTFPIDVRHYLANWIEDQRWEDFNVDSVEQVPLAQQLLEQMLERLYDVVSHNSNVVERVKLQHISRKLSLFQSQPMHLVRMVRDILRKERLLLSQAPMQQYQQMPSSVNGSMQPASNRDLDALVLKVLEIQTCRQEIHRLQEELNWEKQDSEPMQGQTEMETKLPDQVTKQNRITQLEHSYQTCAKMRVQLLQEAVHSLEQCQAGLIQQIKSWRWQQLRSTIGLPFDDNLVPLQTWCEQLLGVNSNLRQEIMLLRRDHGAEHFHQLEESLSRLLQTLIQSSLVVEKQPPQVIKTQSKFSSTVRYLLGEKMAPGKPFVLKAQIITESQARNLGQGVIPTENVGELINSTAILEHNPSSKSTCATFRNMSIKKIKRADRKGSESVTEEKFALLFTAEIMITGCESPCNVQMITLPVVVIVHGSQENNAMATVIWDCAFSEPNRIPFVVPERVPWSQMCEALNSKFMSEVQTNRGLDRYNLHCLAQKIFDKDVSGDLSSTPVSWGQFNKEVLPGRNFTFWQWFEGVIDLTKKCLKAYWSEGLIFGFIGKQHLHVILQNRPSGTFLLRFSDSEIGGITIAYVGPSENGGRKIQNIQPFTKKDLDSSGLGDRIRDINCISHVYPEMPKDDVFKKFYTVLSPPVPDGYLPFKLTMVVEPNSTQICTPQPQPEFSPEIPLQQDQVPGPPFPITAPLPGPTFSPYPDPTVPAMSFHNFYGEEPMNIIYHQ